MNPVNESSTRPGVAQGPWNPGLRSPVPLEVAPLATLFRPEHTRHTFAEIRELADFTGLPDAELVAFRPERLAVHEVLIRVAADLSIPDGPGSEDLGVNFRAHVDTIVRQYVEPRWPVLRAAYDEIHARMTARSVVELAAVLTPAPRRLAERTWAERLGLRAARPVHSPVAAGDRRHAHEQAAIDRLVERSAGGDLEERALAQALVRIVGGVRARHGRIVGEIALLARLVADHACNVLAADRIGSVLEPWIDAAVRAEGFRVLPPQERPVVMNTKGASAAGKSSLRPLQRALAERIGVDWGDFALISPDIFRKYLLDYAALGPHYKYAGMLTGEELRIIDTKLDRYIARKAASGGMPHLLIDRFRFDSFAPHSVEEGSNLLTRFGSEIYMFFVVTAPHLTVERAWERGLRVGRYKTVDDLLHHNVEAFGGMPDLFFTWALRTDKSVHYEFLDNSVASGEMPRTIAFGSDGDLTVLDVGGLVDIERYRRVRIDADSPRAVYPAAEVLAAAANAGFLRRCVTSLPRVDFADPETGRVYLEVRNGRADLLAAGDLERDSERCAALGAVFPDLYRDGRSTPGTPRFVDIPAHRVRTLGCWGSSPPTAAT